MSLRPAIFGKSFDDGLSPLVNELFELLSKDSDTIFVYENFLPFLQKRIQLPNNITPFNSHKSLVNKQPDFLISVGGDGTILQALTYIRDSEIPILGINMGRLGFLSNVPKDQMTAGIKDIVQNKFTLEKRTLLSVETENNLFEDLNFALNELTIHKKDSSSMITINTYVNDEYLNSYWADGLIVATPTGSTAYSLSCGGPILGPNSQNLVITPIAPHNLNVRPIVLSDNNVVKLKVEGRSNEFLVSLDSRSETIDSSIELIIRKCAFNARLIELENQSFFKTIRQKLLWGIDKRN